MCRGDWHSGPTSKTAHDNTFGTARLYRETRLGRECTQSERYYP